MRRYALKDFYQWKDSPNRKPLILKGARQVGKTWLMLEFAKQAFKNFVYVNFEDDSRLGAIFDTDFDIDRILFALRTATKKSIDENTLILFDEIQAAPRALTSLKYFYEKAPQYPVIAAGSLLGLSVHEGVSFPVGKVDFLEILPMNFHEFLEATDNTNYVELLNSGDYGTIDVFSDKLIDLLKLYYVVGGMPEAVQSFANDRDLSAVRRIQKNILNSYDSDFSKHVPNSEVPRIRMVWNSIPAQLSKENKKFIYGMLKEGARAKTFEVALEWLKDSGLISKVHRVKKPSLPLVAYEDFAAFKVFITDVGLLCAMANVDVDIILNGSQIFEEFKGALTEQFVFQQLKAKRNMQIFYWSAENSSGELDFVVQDEEKIYPIEVKAEENVQAKSLRFFVQKNPGLKGIRFSMQKFRDQEWMENRPLYTV
ncbi:AAA family ATPase [uncultured Fibrobacter sp.]|uniref:ATP-binding protein n=1 Tax=uncultured Fibrobacter sp. TaxID=261512 RepID=UPI002638FAB5|nr:AAA family ATPase [uncultured Fibrobacter sp.]